MIINEILRGSTETIRGRKTAVIAFLGDSVTQGCFELYQDKNGGIDTEFFNDFGYHAKLKSLFDMTFPRASVSVINAGISGDVASIGAKRVKEDVIEHKPHLTVVCYGLNDSCAGREKVQEYTDGLRDIFRQLKAAEIDTIFMTPNMKANYLTQELTLQNFDEVLANSVKNQTDGVMDFYMEEAIKVCEEEQVPVCDCYAKWKKLAENGADITRLLSNRLNHPTEKMHWLFAYSLFEKIMGFGGEL